MKEKLKNRPSWGIRKKALTSVIVFAVVTNVLVCLGGSLIFDRAVQKIYNERGYSVANIILKAIDHEKIAEYARTWKADEYYENMCTYLKDIQESSNSAYIYLAVPFEDRTMKYVYDSGSTIGFVDPIAASFDEIWNAYINGERPKSYLVRHSQYGYLTSSCLPVKDGTGSVVALLFVDTDMKIIKSTIQRFIVNMSLISLILLVMSCLLNWLYMRKELIRPIMLLRKNIKSFAQNTNTNDDSLSKINTKDELEELAKSIDGMEKNVRQNIIDLMNLTAEKERIGTELNVATKIQSDVLPKDYPAYPERTDFDLSASMTPAKEVGGDLYDYLLLDSDHLMLVVGDVSGKGVPAALFMMTAKTLISSYAEQNLSPKEIFENTNNQLCKGNESGLFVTCWLGLFTFSTGELKFVNAGHPYPVLYHNGEYSYLKNKPNLVLACMEGLPYTEHAITLSKGDRIFVYSDGVTEATDSNKELFGDDRLLEAMKETSNLSAPETLKKVQDKINGFVKDAEQFDDITMLSFEWKG